MNANEKSRLVGAVKNLLYARRSGNLVREQKAYEKVRDLCNRHNVSASDAIQQVEEHLKQTSVAAIMQGVV